VKIVNCQKLDTKVVIFSLLCSGLSEGLLRGSPRYWNLRSDAERLERFLLFIMLMAGGTHLLCTRLKRHQQNANRKQSADKYTAPSNSAPFAKQRTVSRQDNERNRPT
jgi:hypothetical protein